MPPVRGAGDDDPLTQKGPRHPHPSRPRRRRSEGVEKQAKGAVHYRPAQKERRCGGCIHFQPGSSLEGTCDLVEGPISPATCCDLWRPLKHGAGMVGGQSGSAGG